MQIAPKGISKKVSKEFEQKLIDLIKNDKRFKNVRIIKRVDKEALKNFPGIRF